MVGSYVLSTALILGFGLLIGYAAGAGIGELGIIVFTFSFKE